MRTMVVAVLGLLAAACGTTSAPDSALEQKFVWYRYIAGDDIRTGCTADGPVRFRYIYNAIFTEEVRAIDVEGQAGQGAWLQAHRYKGARMLDIASASILNTPDQASIRLSAEEFGALLETIVGAGFAGPPETGLILRSDDFYGLAAGCRGGEFRIHGYRRDAVPGLVFHRALEVLDPIEAPWPVVYDTGKPEAAISDTRGEYKESSDPYFIVEIGQGGLIGVNEW
jgi:hypothetical protein